MHAWTRSTVAPTVDHTLLRPEATPAEARAACRAAVALGVGAVCLSPTLVATAVDDLAMAGSAIPVAAVKVILESALWDDEWRAGLCRAPSRAGPTWWRPRRPCTRRVAPRSGRCP
ncbi:MAG: hypothetical protein IPM45_13220 [Acidimicrobiales bacterium]|nr:hypothetical protein [Acidimicrobiales bacterium]